ncbi:class I adenylate-forming enzyme family protein [Nonomuraea antimicrobica]|uniref:Class I adenylate-forming enzyme family protein n=1 Tax=Nonomuraea antimicrobica TaxID=561173 RepID=A0ABP7DYD8_9ACTN
MRTVPQLLATRAAQDPDDAAIVVDTVGSMTFQEWERRSGSVARALLDRGVRAGDRVGLLYGGRGWIEFAVAYCAIHKAGGVAVPLPERATPAERAAMLADCSASGLLHESGVSPGWDAGWTATTNELDDGRESSAALSAAPEIPPTALAQILYTSGTTGRPKGVAATHANLTHGTTDHPRRRPLAHSRLFLHAFPIGTNAGQTMLLNALDARPGALTLPRFTPGRFARLIESRAPGTVFAVPSMAIELLRARVHERHDLSSVKLFGCTASALPPDVAVRLGALFPGAVLVNYYTSTEAAPAQTTMVFDPARPTSVGRPASPGDLRIAGKDGAALPAGEAGEVWLRSPTAPRFYYGDPDDAAFRGRWVRMGDVGYLDGDGYLHLVDRDQDVIKSGAFKISTLKIEAALHEHPLIDEAAVFGVPDAVLGERVAAAIVAPPGITGREVRAFLAPKLAPHELPGQIDVRDSLPRNALGKVLKRALREEN